MFFDALENNINGGEITSNAIQQSLQDIRNNYVNTTVSWSNTLFMHNN